MILKNPDRIIDFGLKGSQTYVDHGDKVKRANYLSRHQKREDWNSINPGSASRFILWGDFRDIETNLRDYIKYFNLEVPQGAKIVL
jgi:hypothetical protein